MCNAEAVRTASKNLYLRFPENPYIASNLVKKIAAISLILLLMFNWYGYRFITNYLERKADFQLETRIDANQYSDSQLVEIKVPLNIPYQNNWTEFERHYGEVELNGKMYTYVKRKIEDGFLVLKCLPNTAKQDLKTADNIMFNANNGLDQEHNGGKNNNPVSNLVKNSPTDFDDYAFSLHLNTYSPKKQFQLYGASSFNSFDLPVSEQPPEVFGGSLV